MTPSALSVRARVRLTETRWADVIYGELAARSEWARSRWPVLFENGPALAALARRKQAPLDAGLAKALADHNRALGGSAATLANVARLAGAEAVAAVAGQQPGPLGGPLYTLHKCVTAIALARQIERRTSLPCVPVFWVASEDSDFDEIRTATVADAHLVFHELAIDEGFRREGGLVGAIPSTSLAPIIEGAGAAWAALPHGREAAALQERAARRGADLGEAFAALLLELFAAHGLVVVDARWPALHAAARPLYRRYLERPGELARAVNAAGDLVEQRVGRRALAPAALESWVFAVDDGRRHKVSAGDAAAQLARDALAPSVALRPIVQDALLKAVAMAVGPGELAYLAQLREGYEALGVEPAAPVPRFAATWLPPAACELLTATGAAPWEVVTGVDSVVRRLAEQRLPAGVLHDLRSLRAQTSGALERFAERTTRVDASLPQLVDSARGKLDFQFGRIEEGLVAKARHRIERERPDYLRLRYYLLPGDKLQERRVAALELVAYRGASVAWEMVDAALAHLEAFERGELTHLVAEL